MVEETSYEGMRKHTYSRCGVLTDTKRKYTITVHGEYPTFQGPSIPCAMGEGHTADFHIPYQFGGRFTYREPE